MKWGRAFLTTVLMLALLPSSASATCGTGNPPSYDDITAVMLTGEPYGHFIRRCSQTEGTRCIVEPTTLSGSTFWVLFGSDPDYRSTTFSEYDLRGSVGTFQLAAALSDVLAVFRRDNFFSLSPVDKTSGAGLQVLSVKRCAVVTKIPLYDTKPGDQDAATRQLFDDLDALVEGAKRIKVSEQPARFEDSFLFNP